MVHQPRITVWASPNELLRLRSLFFPETPIHADSIVCKQEAINIVKAWLTRGRIPHAVESTAQLTETLLHDQAGGSIVVTQLAYATAICRFVNGLLDPAQKSHFAVSMHTLAKSLGLPASFVEIRHAASHEVLPSLVVLRKACSRALDWLWSNYWAVLNLSSSDDSGGVSVLSMGGMRDMQKVRIRVLLERWRMPRKNDPKQATRKFGTSHLSKDDIALLKDFTNICAEDDGLEILVDSLIDEVSSPPENTRIPASGTSGPISQGLLYILFLSHLDQTVESFLEALINGVLERVSGDNDDTEHDENKKHKLLTWLEHVIVELKSLTHQHQSSKGWSIGNIFQLCLLQPNKWTIMLLNNLTKKSSALDQKYSHILSIAMKQIDMESSHLYHYRGQTDLHQSFANKSMEDELAQFENNLRTLQGRKNHEAKIATMSGNSSNSQGNHFTINERSFGKTTNLSDKTATVTAGRFRKYNGTWIPKPMGSLIT